MHSHHVVVLACNVRTAAHCAISTPVQLAGADSGIYERAFCSTEVASILNVILWSKNYIIGVNLQRINDRHHE